MPWDGGAPRATAGEGPTVRTPAQARVEAVLFLAREPISSRRIAQLANLEDGTQARSLVRQLSRLYDLRRSAFQVVEVAGGFRLLTRRAFSLWLRRLESVPGEVRFSHPALETLAVVAYRQPIVRAEIESIRGVQCGEILRQLMDRDLVRICGRAEELGRPFLYGTTRHFLALFGLRHLDELPRPLEFGTTQTNSTVAVANESRQRNDSLSTQPGDISSSGHQEVSDVSMIEELDTAAFLTEAQNPILLDDPAAAQIDDEDEDEVDDEDFDDDDEEEEDDDDEDIEDEDLEDEGFDDDEEEDDDEDEDDDEEDDEDLDEDEELDGDWEEVDDEDLDEDEDEDWDEDEEEDDDWDDDEDED